MAQPAPETIKQQIAKLDTAPLMKQNEKTLSPISKSEKQAIELSKRKPLQSKVEPLPKGLLKNAKASEDKDNHTSSKQTTNTVATENGFLKYKEPSAPEAPSTTKMFMKMIVSLATVVALILLMAWAAKKYLGKFNAIPGLNSAIKVLAITNIGMKKQVAVIDVAGEMMIVGITDDNISLLNNVTDQESIDRIRRSASSGPTMSKPKAQTPNMKGLRPEEGGTKAKWTPDFINGAIDAMRIGKIKTSPKSAQAIFDESDPETFAGQLSLAGVGRKQASDKVSIGPKRKKGSKNKSIEQGEDQAIPAPKKNNRNDLLKKVTSEIKAKNGRLKIAG
jgi:flagellar protein FliO/FliZ